MSFNYDVTVHTINNPKGSTVAFANLIITYDDVQAVSISGFKIIKGSKGLFVSPPQTKSAKLDDNGKAVYFDDVRFLGQKAEGQYRTPLQDEVYKLMIQKYEEATSHSARGNAASAHADTNTRGGSNPKPVFGGGQQHDLW